MASLVYERGQEVIDGAQELMDEVDHEVMDIDLDEKPLLEEGERWHHFDPRQIDYEITHPGPLLGAIEVDAPRKKVEVEAVRLHEVVLDSDLERVTILSRSIYEPYPGTYYATSDSRKLDGYQIFFASRLRDIGVVIRSQGNFEVHHDFIEHLHDVCEALVREHGIEAALRFIRREARGFELTFTEREAL